MTDKPDPADKPALLHREEPKMPDLEGAVQRSLVAFNRRDFDAVFAIYWPDAVWDMSPLGLGVFEGCEATRGVFQDWLGSYEDFEQVMEEWRGLGNGVTFVVLLQRARPKGSGGVVALRVAVVGTWRDGLVERFTAYTDIDEARAAAERLAQARGQGG
jgi:ketosteroid isomerase-like protein